MIKITRLLLILLFLIAPIFHSASAMPEGLAVSISTALPYLSAAVASVSSIMPKHKIYHIHKKKRSYDVQRNIGGLVSYIIASAGDFLLCTSLLALLVQEVKPEDVMEYMNKYPCVVAKIVKDSDALVGDAHLIGTLGFVLSVGGRCGMMQSTKGFFSKLLTLIGSVALVPINYGLIIGLYAMHLRGIHLKATILDNGFDRVALASRYVLSQKTWSNQ
jgi:hypothetical protein